jgi:hypothetical protein
MTPLWDTDAPKSVKGGINLRSHSVNARSPCGVVRVCDHHQSFTAHIDSNRHGKAGEIRRDDFTRLTRTVPEFSRHGARILNEIAALTRENATSLGPVRLASAVGWGAFVVVIGSVLLGYNGVTDVRGKHVERMAHKRCMDNLPKPFFSNYSYYGLPWMTPGNEPFVFSFQYITERQAGKIFEKGGIGGLITSGRFKALALVQRPPPKTFDGASFDDFVYRPDLCAEMSILLRKSD